MRGVGWVSARAFAKPATDCVTLCTADVTQGLLPGCSFAVLEQAGCLCQEYLELFRLTWGDCPCCQLSFSFCSLPLVSAWQSASLRQSCRVCAMRELRPDPPISAGCVKRAEVAGITVPVIPDNSTKLIGDAALGCSGWSQAVQPGCRHGSWVGWHARLRRRVPHAGHHVGVQGALRYAVRSTS